MSWLEKLDEPLIITTGDGEQYQPLWRNAKKLCEYNIAEFEFRNLKGTLVDRGEPLGRKFDCEFYFTGEDHIDTAAAFEKSADDKRPWTIRHPYYGSITVQPSSLLYDNSDGNVTKITGTLLETITEVNPRTSVDPIDSIRISKINLDTTFETALTATPTGKDVVSMKAANKKNYNLSVPIIKLPKQVEEYNFAFNQANSFVNTATATPLLAIRSTIRLISLPATFAGSVQDRVNLLNEQFKALSQTVVGLVDPSSKQIYQGMAGSILSSMCLAASTPEDKDYGYANSVINVMDTISGVYRQLLADLDTIQTENGGSPISYIANAQALIELNALVNITVANLFSIALGARKERIVYTDVPTNLIIITHRFYGLDPDDNNLEEMRVNNNLSRSELIQIPKGRKIVYYI